MPVFFDISRYSKEVCFFLLSGFLFGRFPFQPNKNNAVLKPRAGHFRGLECFEVKAKDFKMCPRELNLCEQPLLPTAIATFLTRYSGFVATERNDGPRRLTTPNL